MKKILKIASVVIIWAFLVLDFAWCGVLEKSTLAPGVLVDTASFRRAFDNGYINGQTKDEVFSALADELSNAFAKYNIGHKRHDQQLRNFYRNVLFIAFNNSDIPKQTALNFSRTQAAGPFAQLLKVVTEDLALPRHYISRLLAQPVKSKNPTEVLQTLVRFTQILQKNKDLSNRQKGEILIALSEKPEVIKRRYDALANSTKAQEIFFDFINEFIEEGFNNGGVNIFFILPRNYRTFISTEALATVIKLDEYVFDYYRREGQDISKTLIAPYFTDSTGKLDRKALRFVQLRYLLHEAQIAQNYVRLRTFIKSNDIAAEELIRALLRNKQNYIISQTSDLILELNKGRRQRVGLPEGLVSLAEKIGELTFAKAEIESLFQELRLEVSEQQVRTMLSQQGYKIFPRTRKKGFSTLREDIIIPIAFDVLLSAYRGTAEHDHREADYLTHAITTAMLHYATRGGERKDNEIGAYGANAFHEIDTLIPLVTTEAEQVIQSRKVDNHVSLAYSRNGKALPEWWRKRTVLLKDATISGGSTIADHLDQLMQWQLRERQAKLDIYEILIAMQQGFTLEEELELGISLLQNRLDVLRNHCGLKRAYFDALYGVFDDVFFNSLRSEYDYLRGENNISLIKDLLLNAYYREINGVKKYQAVAVSFFRENGVNIDPNLSKHPWIEHKKTILDYLKKESNLRKHTFEDGLTARVHYGLIQARASYPQQQGELFVSYEAADRKIIPHARNLVTDRETGIAVMKSAIKRTLTETQGDYSSQKLLNVFKRVKYLETLYKARVGKASTSGDHTLRVMRIFEEYFGDKKLPANMSKELFRVLLALHDIGKPEAIVNAGDRSLQHAYTERIIESARDMLPFRERTIDFMQEFIKIDPIGSYMKSPMVTGKLLEDTEEEIRRLANEFKLPVSEVFDLLMIYYQVDSASYTQLSSRGRASSSNVPSNPFDALYEYTPKKDGFMFDEQTGRLKFSHFAQSKIGVLERRMKGADVSTQVIKTDDTKTADKELQSKVVGSKRQITYQNVQLEVPVTEKMQLEARAIEIIPGLWLGNAIAGLQYQDYEVDSILNVSEEVDFNNLPEDISYKKLTLKKGINNVISDEEIQEAVQWIDEQLKQGRKILVNCRVGMARSTSVVIAYLYYKNPNYDFEQIKQRFFSYARAYNIATHYGLQNTLLRLYRASDAARNITVEVRPQSQGLINTQRINVTVGQAI